MRRVCVLVFSMMCFAPPALSEQRNLAEGERELLNLLLTASPEVREAIQEYLDEIPLNGDWGLCKQSVSAPRKWELVAVFTGSTNRRNCIDARAALGKGSSGSAAYQCIPLPNELQIGDSKVQSRDIRKSEAKDQTAHQRQSNRTNSPGIDDEQIAATSLASPVEDTAANTYETTVPPAPSNVEIQASEHEEREPFSLGILIDTSGSMRRKWSWVTAALPSLVHALEPDDEAFVLEINEQPRIIQDLTSSQLGLSQAIDSLRIDGGTSFYEAVLHGLRRIAKGRHRLKGLLVVADDGEDTENRAPKDHVLDRAQSSGIPIYCIGIGSLHGERRFTGGRRLVRFMQELSLQTKGSFYLWDAESEYNTTNEAALTRALQKILEALRTASGGFEYRYDSTLGDWVPNQSSP